MDNLLQRLPGGARVVLIRLRSLGDCVLTTPALELLKRARPDLKLTLVVEKRFAPLFEGNPDVDDLLEPDWRAVRESRPRLCLNLHGGTRSMALTLASGAPIRVGFGHHRGAFVYTHRIPRAQEILGEERKVHTVEHLASAIFHLGAPRSQIPRARLFAQRRVAERPYAVLHPFASAPDKAWPADRFLEVSRHLETAWDVEPVFVGGAKDDFTPFRACHSVVGAPLGQVKRLMAGASLFVGNDSGPAHMAAAFGLPVVVLFGSSDPVIWAPWKTHAQVMAPRGGLGSLPVPAVLEALEKLKAAA